MAAIARMAEAAGLPSTRLMAEFAALAVGPGRIDFSDFERLRLYDDAFWGGHDRRRLVGARRAHELALAVGNTKPGQSVPAKVLRDGKEQTITVAIDTLKQGKNGGMPAPSESEQGGLGLNLAPLDKNTREQLGLASSTQGAVVAGVKPDSPAEQRGIQTGDLIVSIDNVKVESPADAAEAVKKATKAGKKAVLVRINRDGNTALIPVPLKGDG